MIEQHNLARDSVMRQGFEFIKILYRDNFGHETFLRSGYACAERGEHNFLRRVLRLPWKLNEHCRFFAAHPVRHHGFFQLHFTADCFQFVRDIFDCLRRLCRTAQSRPDIIRKMCDLLVGVVAVQSCLLQLFQFRECLR